MIALVLLSLFTAAPTQSTAPRPVTDLSQLPTGQQIMERDSFARAKWCRELNLPMEREKITARLFAPLSPTKIEIVRNLLQMKGLKLPSVTGYFHPPRAKISIREKRREATQLPYALNLLLGAPKYTDEAKTALIGEFVVRGCLVRAVAKSKAPYLAELLHKAAFNRVTLTFRREIIDLLQTAGPTINLYFLPWAERTYNRERHPLKFFKARFAKYILTSSVAGNPRIALQSSPLHLKTKLLDLYTTYRDAGAITPILQLCNSEDPEVRRVARKYMVRYFEGPASKGKVGTIKLPGGVEKQAILYLGARQVAYHAVKKLLEEVTHGDYDRTTSSKTLTLQLFSAWDRERHAKWDTLFSKAIKLYREGFVLDAIKMYNQVLAHGPNRKQKELMFPAYLLIARQALANKKMNKVMRTIRVLSQLAVSDSLEADLYYLLGLSQEANGARDHALHWYRMALRKRPNHLWALGATRTLDPVPLKPIEAWEHALAIALALLMILLGCLSLLFRGGLPHEV